MGLVHMDTDINTTNMMIFSIPVVSSPSCEMLSAIVDEAITVGMASHAPMTSWHA